MKNGDLKKYKWDIILLSCLFICILVSFTTVFLGKNSSADSILGDRADIYINGELYNSYELNRNETINIENEYGFNRIVIENNMVSITEADCHNEECVNSESISKIGESIICLPHRLVVEIGGHKEGEYDSIAY